MDTISNALLRELVDRQDIEECVSRYAHALDRHDEALLADVYHPHAQDFHGPFSGSIPEFVSWVNALHERKTRAHTHNITTHWCEVRGDRAFADSYVIFVLYLREREAVMMGSGRYIDRLERRSGAWKIAERRVIIDMRLVMDAQPLVAAPGGYPKGTWDRSDISYLRPLTLPTDLASAHAQAIAGDHALSARPATLPSGTAKLLRSQAAKRPPEAGQMLATAAARRAIKDCITQSVRGLDRADRALLLEQYARGAHVEDGPFQGSAESYIDTLLARFAQEDVALTHNLTSHLVEIGEHAAVAETYVTLMRFSKDGVTGWVGGLRLLDRLVNRDGRWRIATRRVVADYELTADGSAIDTDAQYLRSRRDSQDISYDRR